MLTESIYGNALLLGPGQVVNQDAPTGDSLLGPVPNTDTR